MRAEADIDLETYRARAPDEERDSLRMQWHLERYKFAVQCHPKPVKVADIGCGLGLGLSVLESKASMILAADINPHVIRFLRDARPRPSVTYSVFDIQDGPLPDSPYDLICLFEVIEHLEQPTTALENLKASMQPGGALVLSTPNSDDGAKGTHPYHVSEFSQDSLNQLLRSVFDEVTIFSQGPITSKKLMAGRMDESRLVRLVRRFDFFHLRRWLPTLLQKKLVRNLTGITESDIRTEFTKIAPGPDNASRWTVAVCAIDEDS